MLHTGKLSAEDAKQLFDPEALLKDVMKTVLAGDKSVSDAVQENEKRIQQLVDGEIKSIDDDEGPLLNVSLYNHLASTLSQPPLSESDSALLESHHKSSLESLSGLITKAQEEMGDMEVLAAKLTVARYSTKCLDKKQAMDAYEQVIASPKLSTGKKLDAYLEMGRVASFYGDVPAFTDILDKATKVIAKGGDWDRRNRLKAYKATSQILIRDLESASKLLVEGIATFSCTELCDYAEFVVYAVVLGVMYLPRVELKKSIIDGSEILTVAKDIPVVMNLANTLYDCDYKGFLSSLVALQPHLVANRYLQPHSGYILRELHILAFRQFLDSYQSVTLESMSTSFGVSTEFLDMQLSRFIASGRLTAKIDNVGRIVETMKTDWKNTRYREMIVKGDLLLNRIQKLGRVVDL
eukprot:scaffold48686_cov60-Cyclotella_meneghiniana.AAC.6